MLALLIAGCGGDDHENLPRPPQAPEVTGSISDRTIRLQPKAVAVGDSVTTPISQNEGVPKPEAEAKKPLVVAFTVANLTDTPTRLHFGGPSAQDSVRIAENAAAEFKLALQTGKYTVSATDGSADATTFEVGPKRFSSQNDLLLP